jgi:hypothetical protein
MALFQPWNDEESEGAGTHVGSESASLLFGSSSLRSEIATQSDGGSTYEITPLDLTPT